MITEIKNIDEFDKFIKKNNLVVCDLYATWCGPCKILSPTLDEASMSYPHISFIKINIDDCDEVAMQFGVYAIPTVLFFKNGTLVHRFTGNQGLDAVKKDIEKAFN